MLGWFAFDDGELDAPHRDFLGVVRERAGHWSIAPGDTAVGGPLSHDGALLAYLDIVDPELRVRLRTVGVRYTGESLTADTLHPLLLTPQPGMDSMTTAGQPAQLGARAADWFDMILARQVERLEWTRAGAPVARAWQLAEPPHTQLMRHGRLQPAELGPPDRVVSVLP
jgi:hypothetical protein